MKLASIEIAGFRGVKQMLPIQCPSGFLVVVGRKRTRIVLHLMQTR